MKYILKIYAAQNTYISLHNWYLNHWRLFWILLSTGGGGGNSVDEDEIDVVELEIEVVEDEGSGVGGFIGFNNLRNILLWRISSRLVFSHFI